jgi:hypothetical protein
MIKIWKKATTNMIGSKSFEEFFGSVKLTV